MLTVGNNFPHFNLKATVSIESLDKAFTEIDNNTYKGKWTCVFFYPKDFTFVCPTEIKGFADLDAQFKDRDCQILAASTDSEFVHMAWRKDHKDLRDLPFPMLDRKSTRLNSSHMSISYAVFCLKKKKKKKKKYNITKKKLTILSQL